MNRITKLKQKETTIFILPAYNEEKNIERTITSWVPAIKKLKGSEMLVINDGSTDNTRQILKKLSSKYKFLKIINKKNEGHGKTIRLGYEKALRSKYTWVFQTDSDGHFDAKDFFKLWIKRNNSDFILGHRYNRKDPVHRKILTRIISAWVVLLFGKYIKDPNIPFRLIKKEYLKDLLKVVPENSFAPNIFLSILAARNGHNLHHIPVTHKLRKNGHNKMKLFKGVLRGFAELLDFKIKLK